MRQILVASLILSLVFLGAGCFKSEPKPELQPTVLQYWRYDDSINSVGQIISSYQQTHPNVKIEVKSFRADEYERELLEALAENRGPDIFSIPNVWLAGWRNKLLPLPETTSVLTLVTNQQSGQSTINKVQNKSVTVRQINDDYVEAVPADVIMMTIPKERDERATEAIWGLPLALDTLSIFYNRELLKQANIERPPQTWKEVQDQVKLLTVKNEDQISQSGAAIGLARNVRHSTELLTAIMLQNNAQMIDSRGLARFHAYTVESREKTSPPGIESLMFYQAFARPGMSTYTWNTEQPDSMDAFIAGKTAFYFGFSHDRNEIREKAPRLDFGVASLPQVDPTRPKNIAHYPVEVVSRTTSFPDLAWDFIQFAVRSENVESFLTATGRPTARRDLIDSQLTNPDAAPFVSQVLTAETWYRGNDWSSVDKAFSTMIETYPDPNRLDYQSIVQNAVRAVNDTIR